MLLINPNNSVLVQIFLHINPVLTLNRKMMAKQFKLDEEQLPSLSSLPNEILIKIFGKLNINDRKSISLVCKKWFDIASMQKFMLDCPFVLKKNLNIKKAEAVLHNSGRIFPYLALDCSIDDRTYAEKILSFLNTFGQSVRCLGFCRVPSIGYETIVEILCKCPNLETLVFYNGILIQDIKLPEMLRVIRSLQLNLQNIVLRTLTFRDPVKLENSYKTNIKFHNELVNFALNFAKENYQELVSYRVENFNLMKNDTLQFKHVSEVHCSISRMLNLTKFVNLKTINLFFDQCVGFHCATSLPQVTNLHYRQPNICCKCLKTMLDSCPNVKLYIETS